MRVECGQMVNPNSIRAQQAAHLADQRATTAMAYQMHWKLCQGVTTEFGNEVRAQEGGNNGVGYLVCIVRIAICQLRPIELDDDLPGITAKRLRPTNSLLREVI